MNKIKAKKQAASNDMSILAQVVALESMDISDLKEKYHALYGKEPPSHSRRQIISRLAYRIQEIAYGGLSGEARTRLENIHEKHGESGQAAISIRKEHKGTPMSGTRLIREYLGQTHEVVVCENGFAYKDGMHRSLSSIAKIITGSHTSGPAFFGLKKKGGEK